MKIRKKTLLDLAADTLKDEVAKPNLDAGSLINFALVNKSMFQLFQPTLLQLQQLKKHIERSEKEEVDKLAKRHPNFLLDACKYALTLGDMDMLNMIMKGRENVLKQIILPSYLVHEKNTYDFSIIVKTIEEFSKKKKTAEEVEAVLTQFRKDIDKIVEEKGFPFQALLDAYKIYKNKYAPWTVEQCNKFCVNVIGYLQRLSPAWLKKIFTAGVYYIAEEEGDWYGSNFILQSGESIDPSHAVPHSGLGFDFCVDIFGTAFYLQSRDSCSLMMFRCNIEKLFRAKTAELDELIKQQQEQCPTQHEPARTRCVIL